MELRNVFADKKVLQEHTARTESQLTAVMAAQKTLADKLENGLAKELRELKEEFAAQKELLGNISRASEQMQVETMPEDFKSTEEFGFFLTF